MTSGRTLHAYAQIEADFPHTMADPVTGDGPAPEFATWLHEQLCDHGIVCEPPEDIEYAREIVCHLDGHVLSFNIGVELISETEAFDLIFTGPRESSWKQWRRGSRQPEWLPALCQLAETIHESLESSERVTQVTWLPTYDPGAPQPTYDHPTSEIPTTEPVPHWYDWLVEQYWRMDRFLAPIVLTTFAGALLAALHPLFGLILLPAIACGVVWISIKFAGLGGGLIIVGTGLWEKHQEAGIHTLWAGVRISILVSAGVLIAGYFLSWPFLLAWDLHTR